MQRFCLVSVTWAWTPRLNFSGFMEMNTKIQQTINLILHKVQGDIEGLIVTHDQLNTLPISKHFNIYYYDVFARRPIAYFF